MTSSKSSASEYFNIIDVQCPIGIYFSTWHNVFSRFYGFNFNITKSNSFGYLFVKLYSAKYRHSIQFCNYT